MSVPTVLFLVCPLLALVLGLSTGLLWRRWWLGSVISVAVIAVPVPIGFDWNPQLLVYALCYGIIGLLGSGIGTGTMRWLSRRSKNEAR